MKKVIVNSSDLKIQLIYCFKLNQKGMRHFILK